ICNCSDCLVPTDVIPAAVALTPSPKSGVARRKVFHAREKCGKLGQCTQSNRVGVGTGGCSACRIIGHGDALDRVACSAPEQCPRHRKRTGCGLPSAYEYTF